MYHINIFANQSESDLVTANPVQQRDTYFIASGGKQTAENAVEINKGEWGSFNEAFPHANFIFAGTEAYCFWDSGKSQIFAITSQEAAPQVVYEGSAGTLNMTVNSNGSLSFAPTAE